MRCDKHTARACGMTRPLLRRWMWSSAGTRSIAVMLCTRTMRYTPGRQLLTHARLPAAAADACAAGALRLRHLSVLIFGHPPSRRLLSLAPRRHASAMSHPRGQELNPSARFARGDLEEASRLAAVKLSQDDASDTTSVGSVVSPPTPHVRADARTRAGDAASEARDELPGVRRDITAVVGNTPCVFLSKAVTAGCVATVVAKLESSEPCCSVKDRCAAQRAWRVSFFLSRCTFHGGDSHLLAAAQHERRRSRACCAAQHARGVCVNAVDACADALHLAGAAQHRRGHD
jgi:hypothetical protein